MKIILMSSITVLFVVLSGGCSAPKERINVQSIRLTQPIVVTYYDLFDCGASQINIKDKAGHQLYFFNKPFLPDLFLSTKTCTETPDMTCSIHITKGHPIQKDLIACLEQFLAGEGNEKKLAKITKETDFTKLTQDERILQGSLYFLRCLKAINEAANTVPKNIGTNAPNSQH